MGLSSFLLPLSSDRLLGILPLIPPIWLFITLLDNHIPAIKHLFSGLVTGKNDEAIHLGGSISSQLLAHVTVAIFGFVVTNQLIPHIKQYTLRKGISGKDLGKRGTATAHLEM